MQYRSDRKGNPISILGYGCMRFARKGNAIDEDRTEREILLAIRSGVTYFDTAYIYPGSESCLGRILEKNGMRDRVTIATKLPQYLITSAGAVDRYFNEQLQRLRTDHVDIIQFHNPPFVPLPGGKDGLYDVAAKVLIDCTGDANLSKLAGAKLNVLNECQPGTFSCYAMGYDFASLDMEELQKNFEKAVEAGEVTYDDLGWNRAFTPAFLKKHGHNSNHITGINAADSAGRTRMEMAGRASLMRLFRFLKKQKGFENLEFKLAASECGVRESRTVQGIQTITVDDYVSGRVFDNAVCYSYYPVDLHDAKQGLVNRKIQPGHVPTVPLGALIPKGLSNFMVAGRILSSDRLANSALRIQATCMATGQAAGAAAALAIQHHCEPADVDLDELRCVLQENHAIVPPSE